MTSESYMASLRLCPHEREEAPKAIHYVGAKTKVKEVEELELDPRINNNTWVKPIEKMSTFHLGPKEGHVTQLGNQLSSDD